MSYIVFFLRFHRLCFEGGMFPVADALTPVADTEGPGFFRVCGWSMFIPITSCIMQCEAPRCDVNVVMYGYNMVNKWLIYG